MTEERSAGRALARAYFEDLVEPVLRSALPGLRYAAGRLGTGSDVLGLDDRTSRDHDWGLRLTLLVPEPAVHDVRLLLESALPESFRGLPTRFRASGEPAPRLHADVGTIAGFLHARTGVDPRSGMTTEDWLSLTGQAVLEVTAGPVFADRDDELTRARAALAWYPDDLWRSVLACDWARIAEELPLMGRAADVGDERGARIIAARIAHLAMHLAFTLEQRWAPYAKWFGTVFATLRCAGDLGPSLDLLLDEDDRRRRRGAEAGLQLLLSVQEELVPTGVGTATILFWDRPHLRPDPGIVDGLMASIADPALASLPVGLGSAEQRTDAVAVLVDHARRRALITGS